jgi:tellurite resistance protein
MPSAGSAVGRSAQGEISMSEARNKYVPAAFFGIVLGLAGLGTSWRIAASLWPVPQSIGEAITLTAVAVWAVLMILYASKWIWAPAEGLAEFHHPVLCCFVGVIPVSTALIASCDPALRAAHSGSSRGSRYCWTVDLRPLPDGPTEGGVAGIPRRPRRCCTSEGVAGSFVSAITLSAFGHLRLGRTVFRCGCIFMARNRVRATSQAVHHHRAAAAVTADFRVYSWRLRLSAAAPT